MNTQNFTFDKNLKKMYACASDVGFEPRKAILIKSHRTGNIEAFKLQTVKYDHDGDIVMWEYVPMNFIPNLNRVVIFND